MYEKSLHLSSSARQAATVGEIVNHQAVDAQRFQQVAPHVHLVCEEERGERREERGERREERGEREGEERKRVMGRWEDKTNIRVDLGSAYEHWNSHLPSMATVGCRRYGWSTVDASPHSFEHHILTFFP